MQRIDTLSTTLGSLQLCSPLVLAAGTAGTLDEMDRVADMTRIGAVVTKSITRLPRSGNPFPRITFTRAGMLNAIGLANPGLDAFVRDIAPRARSLPCRVIASVAGDSIEDYTLVASSIAGCEGIDALEINVSCPNVHSGLEFGADPEALGALLNAIAPQIQIPFFVKLSPIVIGTPSSIVDLAAVAIESGAGGLTLTNTVPAMGIDIHTRKPVLANTTGGLSGPAIHPIVVRLVHLVYSQLARDAGVPIMAAGGVTRWQDAAEFILAGASGVQIGAGSFANPRTTDRIHKGLARWVRKQGCGSITDLIGRVC